MSLTQLLVWLISGGGGGVIASWIIERWPWAKGLQSELKRYLAWAMTALFAVGAFFLLGWLGQTAQVSWLGAWPQTAQEWANTLWIVATFGILGGGVKHGRMVLSKK